MSKHSSTPRGAGSHNPRKPGTTGNKSTNNNDNTRAVSQTGGTAPQMASSASPKESANYRARRAAAVRASASAKASGQPHVSARTSQKRARNVPWWQRGNTLLYAAVGVVAALVIVFVIISQVLGSHGSTNGNLGTPTSASVAKAVTQVSPSVIDAVGAGSVTNPLQATKGAPLLVGTGGKPQVVYIGADYCPFCAAERWSLIVSLSRFGTFANLHDMTSSSTDQYPSTPTFSFYGSTYSSQYVDFTAVETTTQDPYTPLQTPTAEQQQLLNTYDAPPYTSAQNKGAIPFVDIGGRYVLSGSGYSPQLLQGLTRDQIAQNLSNANDPATKAIVGHANYLTAAICVATQNKPAQVCSSSTIQAIEQTLPKGS